MKTWMYALMGLVPNIIAWNCAVAGPEGECPKQVIVQTMGEPGTWVGDGGVAKVVVVGEGGEYHGQVVVTASAEVAEDGRSDRNMKKINVITQSDEGPDAAQRGWLGVAIATMPESLLDQLGTGDRGVLVSNIVEGSPAAAAGIEPHDVIVAVDGQDVGGDLGPAVDLIKSRKPGETINVTLLRGGQEKTVAVTLGSRADAMGKLEWKFEGQPQADFEEKIKTRGKFMVRGPGGELVIKDLGDLDELKNLPDNIRMFVPQSGSRSTQVFVENGRKTIKMNVENDGSTIAIEQDAGGRITVRRTDEEGQESVADYENEDALKAGDEEAYNLYAQAEQSMFIHDADGGPHIFLQGVDGDAGQWRAHLEESLAQAQEAYEKAMEELHANLEEWKADGTFDVDQLHDLFHRGESLGHAFTFQMGKPKHRFDVAADGSIEVSIRKGDSEMIQSFKNEADMAARRPDLFEKFQDLKAVDEE